MKNVKSFTLILTTALLLLIATVFSLTTAGCGGGGGGSAPSGDIINTPLLGTIAGKVIDQSGNPIADAMIKIATKAIDDEKGTETRANYGATSGDDGTFKIQNVPAGNGWPMAISKSGFVTLQLTVDSVGGKITQIPEDETVLVSSEPTPTPSPEPTISPSPSPSVTPSPSPSVSPSPSPSVSPSPSPSPSVTPSPSPSPSVSPSPSPSATVNIVVKDYDTNALIEGATVEFFKGGVKVYGPQTTDSLGKTVFTVEPGGYLIQTKQTGYITTGYSPDIVSGINNVEIKIEKK